ncbi:MAG TPA: DEAD/DEAH box helicase [Verrucomicrobiae bacterium]|nr:DEAD/DEAH box helicase [Verrucomicrobiae bacterium]
MAKTSRKTSGTTVLSNGTKYDAHHTVLAKAYGSQAELRRELADSKAAVAERAEILNIFAECGDPQRAWLLLEDYFEKLSLSRKDFATDEWWPRLVSARGKKRLEETAILFMRFNRPVPTELQPHADIQRFVEIEQAEKEQKFVQQLEHWLFPSTAAHLDQPRAALRIACDAKPISDDSALFGLSVTFLLSRHRTGEKVKTLTEIVELTTRTSHEEELFSFDDWEFIQWLSETHPDPEGLWENLVLSGIELLQWLVRWGDKGRLSMEGVSQPLAFHGDLAQLEPHLDKINGELSFTQNLIVPDGRRHPLSAVRFFAGRPSIALVDNTFYLLRTAPPDALLNSWAQKQALPVSKLSHRLLTKLRKTQTSAEVDWEQLCTVHTAKARFTFELVDDLVRLRLLARSEKDDTSWHWSGQEWEADEPRVELAGKPAILDDPRLEKAIQWLCQLDWFTPEPGLWMGDANDNFLVQLAAAWPGRPDDAEYLGNVAFQRLFLAARPLRPRLAIKGSGIDWFAISAEWEAEGIKLTPADLLRLQSATGRFVKLPDAGWMQLDADAVQDAHETFANLGVDGLVPVAQRLGLEHAAHLDEAELQRFGDTPEGQALRKHLKEFSGIPPTPLPPGIDAELRPYQQSGFNFLCHLTRHNLGGILADDMGLGKTLQTLAWLAWSKANNPQSAPALVICPASVLHNWRREASRFTPALKVLVLESGAARHNLRKQIPEHDLIVTNYALLRRDLEALQRFSFRVVILDEAQFIKNPDAQITISVKQLKAEQHLALTGTPLENRLLDLWSIIDFVQPSYLGSQQKFREKYEMRGENAEDEQRIARRRLSAKMRPLMLRRLKREVARDLPERIEQRRDCVLGEPQRKLYLAELRRSREQVMEAVAERGVKASTIHVLAALTRLRQICCHPALVGSDAASGKTETLFELLEPLLAENQKVLLFSQFVQMLRILEKECAALQIPTHILTGETKDRQEVMHAFQEDPNAGVFLLSLRAAGTGLNLTTASNVILYDPWWNPAVEAQAIDRSHRIGQTLTVNAYRLIAPGTVEEKIWELQQRKAQTIADVLGEQGFARNLSQGDLEYLFAED